VASTPMFSSDGHIVGAVDGIVFRKTLSGKRHFLRKPLAIATDALVLEQAQELGAEMIEVRDKDTGDVYRASIQKVMTSGIEIDRGFGAQIALPLIFWQVEKPN